MKLENQVTNVELSNKLHELGVTEPSLFFRDSTKSKEEDIEFWGKPDYCPDNVACYTTAELGELLPNGIDYIITTTKCANRWLCRCEHIKGAFREILHDEWDETEANARAKCLIYLIENNLLIVKK